MISQSESDELFTIPFLIRLELTPELTISRGEPGEPLLPRQGLLVASLAFPPDSSVLLHCKVCFLSPLQRDPFPGLCTTCLAQACLGLQRA